MEAVLLVCAAEYGFFDLPPSRSCLRRQIELNMDAQD